MKLFIFDMGGVMVDGFDVVPALASDLGITPDVLRAELDAAGMTPLHDGAITPLEFWQRYGVLTGRSVAGEPWRDYFKPVRRPAMYALVRQLQDAGYRVVAGTNTIDPHYAMHEANGDYAVFDHVYASNLMGVSKPEAEFWRHILGAERVAASDALFVDDLAVNVAGAAALGITAVQYETAEQVSGAVLATLPVPSA